MRRYLSSLFVLSVLTIAGRADDTADALAIVNKAIQAHGGETALLRSQVLMRSAIGEMTLFGKSQPIKDEMVVSLPERVRHSMELGSADQRTFFLLVINGDKGWQVNAGAVTELPKERLVELHDEASVLYISTLVPLKKNSEYALSTLPEAKVNGRAAVGIKAFRKGSAEPLKLYFDKATGLLVKIERRAKEASLTIDKEYVYSDHKDVDGVKLPTKETQLMNGNKFVEISSYSYKLLRRAEDALFAKP